MIRVANDELKRHAERLLSGRVSRADLALAFDESTASSAEVLVEGANFYPRMLEDIAAASSSIHINQFGFRPGAVGDRFAEALLAKAKDGVPVRLVVDRQGSDPERGTKQLYDELCAAGADVCVVRATKPRSASGPLGGGGALHWNLAGLGHIDHRKVVVVDGRIGWVGGAGIGGSLRGRALPRPVRPRHRPRRFAVPARVRCEPALAGRRARRDRGVVPRRGRR